MPCIDDSLPRLANVGYTVPEPMTGVRGGAHATP